MGGSLGEGTSILTRAYAFVKHTGFVAFSLESQVPYTQKKVSQQGP